MSDAGKTAHDAGSPGSAWGSVVIIGVIALVTAAVAIGAVLIREKPYSYDLSTPERAFASARLMIERGDADRLGDLIEATNEDERRLYRQLGITLGRLQDLAVTVREEMPEELARYQKDLADAAARGEPVSFFARIGARRPGGRRPPPDQGGAGMFRAGPYTHLTEPPLCADQVELGTIRIKNKTHRNTKTK